MIGNRVSGGHQPVTTRFSEQFERDLGQAQQAIYSFLLDIVKSWPPEDVLTEFQHLFIQHAETSSSGTLSAVQTILFANNETEFRNTIKRSCYILINNWEVARHHTAIQSLIKLFADPILHRKTVSPTLKRLRTWLINFIGSQDFQDLELFVARFANEQQEEHWSNRYTSYLLVPQYIDTDNPIEQREAARVLSRRLKDKFKFDLAMYTVYSQSNAAHKRPPQNPTALGDGALRLIKTIVAKKGQFSYKNLAHLFLQQTKELNYLGLKHSLLNYLLFSVGKHEVSTPLKESLSKKIMALYTEYDFEPANPSLLLRTCNRVIDALTTEDKKSPSHLFTLLLSQGSGGLVLAVILLKLILISRNSHPYLEARIADLIRYYQGFSQDQCDWVINFLEVFSVTFAIYAENVEYNLVQLDKPRPHGVSQSSPDQRHKKQMVRIFSQMVKQAEQTDLPDITEPE